MNYTLQADEAVLYEGTVSSRDYKGSIIITLTSQKIVIEKETGVFKKVREVVDNIGLENIKIYNGVAQVNMDDLIEVCVGHMANEQFTGEQVRAYLADMLPKLRYWKEQKNLAGAEAFEAFKQDLIDEINGLNVAGMPKLAL